MDESAPHSKAAAATSRRRSRASLDEQATAGEAREAREPEGSSEASATPKDAERSDAKRSKRGRRGDRKGSDGASSSGGGGGGGGAGGASRRVWIWGALAFVATIGAIGGFVAFSAYRAKSGAGRAVSIEIEAGESDGSIVAKLEAAGVVDSGWAFAVAARATGGVQAKPGPHLLPDDLAPVEVLRRLRRAGDSTRVKFVVPEGLHKFEIARRLRDKRVCDDRAFLDAAADPVLLAEFGLVATAEGWLFPATYDLRADADPREVARAMLVAGKQRIDRLLQQHAAGAEALRASLGWGPREIVTLASIVEKEAAVDDERPIVASVFLNRMRDPNFHPKSLQADPTAAYGCLAASPPPASCARWLATGSNKVTAEVVHDPANAWGSYPPHENLPPTPISNPGERSIAAVLAPAQTRFYYFVAKGGGRHSFSESLGTHNQNVAKQPR